MYVCVHVCKADGSLTRSRCGILIKNTPGLIKKCHVADSCDKNGGFRLREPDRLSKEEEDCKSRGTRKGLCGPEDYI